MQDLVFRIPAVEIRLTLKGWELRENGILIPVPDTYLPNAPSTGEMEAFLKNRLEMYRENFSDWLDV